MTANRATSAPQPFPSTHWSLVEEAGQSDAISRKQALADLLHRYLPALRCHLIFARRMDADLADDFLQGFTTDKVLEQNILSRAEQQRGRFRNFLLTSLNHYIANHLRSERSSRRSPAATTPLEEALIVPTGAKSLADHYDIAWAREVLNQALERMREECRQSARPDIWGVFEGRILNPILHHAPPRSYRELVAEHQFVSPSQASNVLTTANRMFIRLLRRVIGRYACNDMEIDQEIADLRKILSTSGAVSRPAAGNYQ